jgi:hypothetical protein
MANKVYVNIIGTDIILSAVCTEDIQVQAQSQFSSIGDMVPGINQLANLVVSGSSVTGGTISRGMADVKNALDVPTWQRTEPVKVAMDMNFFLKTSGYLDVWYPTMVLQSMNILSRKGEGQDALLITPGFNVGNIGKEAKIQTASNNYNSLETNLQKFTLNDRIGASQEILPSTDTLKGTSKLCCLYIPSIVYLPVAYVENVAVTWSKQKTDQGYPIWSKVNVQFTGATPAVFEDNFLSICPENMNGIYV